MGGLTLGALGVAADILGDALHRLVHFGVADVGEDLLDLKGRDVSRGEVWHQIDGDGEAEIDIAINDGVDVAHRFNARLDGGLQGVVGDRLLAAFADGLFDHFAQN